MNVTFGGSVRGQSLPVCKKSSEGVNIIRDNVKGDVVKKKVCTGFCICHNTAPFEDATFTCCR